MMDTRTKVLRGLKCCGADNVIECSKCPYTDGAEYCIRMLQEDTLDVVATEGPRLATWKKRGRNGWECSACGFTLFGSECTFLYCPACGAWMIGG